VTQPKIVLADTGPLYAAADSSDGLHHRAQRELGIVEHHQIEVVVPLTTLIETHKLLLRRFARARVRPWLDSTIAVVTVVYPQPIDFVYAVDIVRRYPDQSLTLHDALLAALSERLDLPIWTYDFHFDLLRANRWYPE
jgi:uncharacterized protein